VGDEVILLKNLLYLSYMRLKTYLVLVTLGTILAWSSFFLVLNLMRPDDLMNIFWFYLTFGLSLFGTLHLALYAWDSWRKKNKLSYSLIFSTERQSLVLTVFLLLLLWMQTNSQLTWWLFLLAVLILVVVEYVFLSYDEVV
jgi:hypothetical protein